LKLAFFAENFDRRERCSFLTPQIKWALHQSCDWANAAHICDSYHRWKREGREARTVNREIDFPRLSAAMHFSSIIALRIGVGFLSDSRHLKIEL